MPAAPVRAAVLVPDPPLLSLLEPPPESPGGPEGLRAFLERLVEAAAKHEGLVVGEAEPGRYLLVMPPLAQAAMQAEIDAGLDLVLGRLGARWPSPHVTDFGLRELYAKARDRWLDPRGMESLVQEGKIGVVIGTPRSSSRSRMPRMSRHVKLSPTWRDDSSAAFNTSSAPPVLRLTILPAWRNSSSKPRRPL